VHGRGNTSQDALDVPGGTPIRFGGFGNIGVKAELGHGFGLLRNAALNLVER